MRFYFYPSLLAEDGITHQDRIVFSYLLYQTFWFSDDTHTERGEVRNGLLTIDEALSSLGNRMIFDIKPTHISNDLGISLRGYEKSMERLSTWGLVDGNELVVPSGTMDRFFELQMVYGLSGVALITYSYLCNLADSFKHDGRKNHVTIKLGRLAEEIYGMPGKESCLSYVLSKLSASKFITMKRGGWNVDIDIHRRPE